MPKAVLKSWGMLLGFAVPGSLGMIMTPISHTIVTRLAAGYGNAAVAAIGVSVRLRYSPS